MRPLRRPADQQERAHEQATVCIWAVLSIDPALCRHDWRHNDDHAACLTNSVLQQPFPPPNNFRQSGRTVVGQNVGQSDSRLKCGATCRRPNEWWHKLVYSLSVGGMVAHNSELHSSAGRMATQTCVQIIVGQSNGRSKWCIVLIFVRQTNGRCKNCGNIRRPDE